MTTARRRILLTLLVTLSTVGPIVASAPAPAAAAAASTSAVTAAGAAPVAQFRPTCADPAPGRMACMSIFRTTSAHQDGRAGARATAARPAGLRPADIVSAYGLADAPAPHSTVAIVDAYDDPSAESDLAVYRRTWGLPPCTTANGCFRKVNQGGTAGPLPAPDPGWALEISLDLDAVSASCPTCNLLLVEADSAQVADLGLAVDTAVHLGANVVSNSYGTTESPSSARDAVHWTHPGTSIVASTGDSGFTTASFPAVLGTTIAVGGTSLARTTSGWREQAWSGAGSGCSAYVAKPAWQHDGHCPMRTATDVSAVADPATGLAVYDSYGLPAGQSGFLVAGGTSLSAPLLAGMIARSGRPLSNARPIYAHPRLFTDVIGGSTGYCGGDYLCTGRRGYDSPTGIGTPRGVDGL